MSSATGVRPKGSIVLEGVSKGYRLYRKPADRVREALSGRPRHDTHWALQDVSLSIAPGETFGVIGENGAGKSSLLKLVAGTTRPTHGTRQVAGSVAALLELGAGFHPEESGRQNIFMMAALAGVPAREMESHYREIADFSELSEAVLQRPVKTYSSGMFMRLGFATATAVDPDVLIVDEALSVGDIHFQKKSLDRIMRFREQGKTVLFCSHNLYQIRSLCTRAVWIHGGRIAALGDTETVVAAYENHEREKTGASRPDQVQPVPHFRPAAPSLAPARLTDVSIAPADNAYGEALQSLTPACIRVTVEALDERTPFHVAVAIVRNDKENIFGTSTQFEPAAGPFSGVGEHVITLTLPALKLLSGRYLLSAYVLDDTGLQVMDMAELVCPFEVFNPGRHFGMVHMDHEWRAAPPEPEPS